MSKGIGITVFTSGLGKFGVLKFVITNNNTQFNIKKFKEFYQGRFSLFTILLNISSSN